MYHTRYEEKKLIIPFFLSCLLNTCAEDRGEYFQASAPTNWTFNGIIISRYTVSQYSMQSSVRVHYTVILGCFQSLLNLCCEIWK